MEIREPARAGMFYEAGTESCRRHATKLLDVATVSEELSGTLYGGLAPHAGWTYSGEVAARTVKALHERGGLKTVVLFGADHFGTVDRAEVFSQGAWRTPLGNAAIDEELAQALVDREEFRDNPEAHSQEHSLEVIVPLLQAVAPEVRILPIGVPAAESAVGIGRAVGRLISQRNAGVQVIGSTDLTHYGGMRFPAPGGRGEKGEKWAAANDQRMLKLIEQMDADAIVPEARQHLNACGAGAVAATVAACREAGARRGVVLEYTNSYRIVHEAYPYEMDDTTVGYASVVFE